MSFDALRADALGAYGAERPATPNLDRFADEAVTFERAHASAQATPTSFAGAFTGSYPFRTFRGWQLTTDRTLAAQFQATGYRTAFFANNIQLMPERGFSAGFDAYHVLPTGDDEDMLPRVLAWLEEEAEPPFFAWFHFLSPHSPYEARPLAEPFYEAGYEGPFARTTRGQFIVTSEADRKRVEDLYTGEVYYADWIFGQLIDRLTKLGLRDDTLIVVTSDHGEEFGEHGQYQHNHVFEEVARIPLLIGHPDLAGPLRSRRPASNVDLWPTLAGLAGLAAPEGPLDGYDLLGEVPDDRVKIVAAMTHSVDRQLAVIQGEHKLIVVCAPEFDEMLFDLATDPGETSDRILDDPPRAEALAAAAEASFGEEPCAAMQKAAQGMPIEAGLTDEQIERLRSLGYIQ